MTAKVAIVVQRYGAEIVGGGEMLTKQVAERLHHSLGWEVDVYTTTAKDYRTWANEYPEGVENLNGVRVHRFNSRAQRWRYFDLFNHVTGPLLRKLRGRRWAMPLVVLVEWLWILFQGPYCPKLINALRKAADEYDKIIFVTYLYYPTLAGVRHLGDKAILIPLAHDEHPFHFLIVERLLQSVKSILTNTPPEAALIRPKLGSAPAIIEKAGIGFDENIVTPKPRVKAEQPYLLYLGRISAGKGVAQLVSWFQEIKTRHHFQGLRLVLAGHLESSVVIPKTPDVEYLGYIDESAKLDLIRNALAVVNPSPHESLSMIVIEALALRVPVLVNEHCEVLRFYTEQVKTVFGFRDQLSFEQRVIALVQTPWDNAEELRALDFGREWALESFSWSKVLAVYDRHVHPNC